MAANIPPSAMGAAMNLGKLFVGVAGVSVIAYNSLFTGIPICHFVVFLVVLGSCAYFSRSAYAFA